MPDMKGITVRIDAALHAEIKAYLEQHEMTMGEFIALAAQDELHPTPITLALWKRSRVAGSTPLRGTLGTPASRTATP